MKVLAPAQSYLLGLTLLSSALTLPTTAGSPDAPPATASPVTEFDASSRDRLWLHQGDPLTGRLVNETFELHSPYGRLLIPVAQIVELRLAEGPTQIDIALTIDGSRFSGLLIDPAFPFQPVAGPQLTLRRDVVTRVSLSRPGTGPSSNLSTLVFLMRNGDSFSGRIAGSPLRVATPQVDVRIDPDAIGSVSFDASRPLQASLRGLDGTHFEGLWPDQELEVELNLGIALRIYPGRIAAIRRAAAFAEPSAPSNRPTAPGSPDHELTLPGLLWIPPGEFVMGSPTDELDRELDEGPQTLVRITRGFWMGACEVTQADYHELMGVNPSLFIGDPRRPVEKVRHRDAAEYCARLTRRDREAGRLPEGYGYRLPTEAEWEYACRAGTTTRFSHGNDPDGYRLEDYAWFSANSDSSTQPVGTRKPNPWGLHDMSGNVLEWCLDGAGGPLPGGEVVDFQATARGLLRVARGGSWLYGAKACRAANRDSYGESTRSSDLGFRVVLALENPPATAVNPAPDRPRSDGVEPLSGHEPPQS